MHVIFSAEMAEKIAQNELRLITQLSFGPLDLDNLVSWGKQFNSLIYIFFNDPFLGDWESRYLPMICYSSDATQCVYIIL